MEKVNSDVEPGEAKVVNSRYSIVMATSRRARQLIDGYVIAGEDPEELNEKKPLSIAVEELYNGDIHIINKDDEE